MQSAKDLGLELNRVNDAYLGNTDSLGYLREEYAKAQSALKAKMRAQQRANGVDGQGKEATDGLAVAQTGAFEAEQARVTGLRALIDGASKSTEETAESALVAEAAADAQRDAAAAARSAGSSMEDLATGIGMTVEEFEDLTKTMSGSIAQFVNFGTAYEDVLSRKQEAEQAAAQASTEAAGDTSGAWRDAGADVKVTFAEWIAELDKQGFRNSTHAIRDALVHTVRFCVNQCRIPRLVDRAVGVAFPRARTTSASGIILRYRPTERTCPQGRRCSHRLFSSFCSQTAPAPSTRHGHLILARGGTNANSSSVPTRATSSRCAAVTYSPSSSPGRSRAGSSSWTGDRVGSVR